MSVPLAAAFLGLALAPSASSGGSRFSGSAPSAAAPYGLIWLDVEPGSAEITLDGEYLDTGVWLISVAPGSHELRVRKAGFRGYEERIAVPAGGSVRLDVRLVPGSDGDS